MNHTWSIPNRYEILTGFMYLEIGTAPIELSELEIQILCLIGHIEWEEKHPLYGTSQCPEPGTIQHEGLGLKEVHLVHPVPWYVHTQNEKGVFHLDNGKRYFDVMEITDYLSEDQWTELEREAMHG